MLFGEQIGEYLKAQAQEIQDLIDKKEGIECYEASFYYVLEFTTREDDEQDNKNALTLSIEGLFPKYADERICLFAFDCDSRVLENVETVADLLVRFFNTDFNTIYNENSGYSINYNIEHSVFEQLYEPYKELFYMQFIGTLD